MFVRLKEQGCDCMRHITENRNRIFLMGLLVFFFHGSKWNSANIGIDTEDVIRLQESFYTGWIQTGRPGLVLIKKLLGTLSFNPYFCALLTLLLLGAAVSAFFLVLDKVSDIKMSGRYKTKLWLTGGLFFISHPVLTESMYFSLQSMEISLGILLCVSAMYLIYYGYGTQRKWWCYICCTILLLLVFLMYQSYIVLYLLFVVTLQITWLTGRIYKAEPTHRQERMTLMTSGILSFLVPYVVTFLAAFALHSVLTRLFFSSSSAYLTDQIQWGSVPWKENILRIIDHVISVLTGRNSIYYHGAYGLFCLFAACLLLGITVKQYRYMGRTCMILWIYYLSLMAAPFLMTLVIGGSPVIRCQFFLPVITGFAAYYTLLLIHIWRNLSAPGTVGKFLILSAVLISIWGVCGQAQVTLRLYYTEDCRYEQDVFMGRLLIYELEQLGDYEGYPLVVIGRKEFSCNNACLAGETMGHSFFDFDTDVEPAFYYSSRRVVGFLHCLGYQCGQASREETQAAALYASDMPCWPRDGSLRLVDGMIVIKLSDSLQEQ